MESEFKSYDKNNIFYKKWESSETKAIIQIFHGLGEMADYYEEFAREANKNNLTVYLFEYRGHGRTKAPFGEGNIFDQYVRDSLIFNTLIKKEYPDKKIFAIGHSLGTGIIQGALNLFPEFWAGVILTGLPDQRYDEKLIQGILEEIGKNGPDAPNVGAATELFGNLNDSFASEGSTLSWLTRDAERRDYYERLPYTNVSYSNRFYLDQAEYSTKMNQHGLSELENKDFPILILTGGNDIIADHGKYGDTKVKELIQKGFEDATSIVYPEFRHSILQEVGRDIVYNDIFDWIAKHNQY